MPLYMDVTYWSCISKIEIVVSKDENQSIFRQKDQYSFCFFILSSFGFYGLLHKEPTFICAHVKNLDVNGKHGSLISIVFPTLVQEWPSNPLKIVFNTMYSQSLVLINIFGIYNT